VRGVEAGRVKEKIYGYRDDDVLEGLRREKRMEEPHKRRISGGMFDPGVDSVQISAKAQGDANHLKRLGVLSTKFEFAITTRARNDVSCLNHLRKAKPCHEF
jgi:hypothetical protein